jgi:hypothetical protein
MKKDQEEKRILSVEDWRNQVGLKLNPILSSKKENEKRIEEENYQNSLRAEYLLEESIKKIKKEKILKEGNEEDLKKEKSFEALSFYAERPENFCEDFIGVFLDDWQKRAFEALIEHHYLAIRSGSGIGKTAFISLALIWFLSTHPMSKVPATAPSQHQLFDLLWSECFRWIQRSSYLQKTLNWTAQRISVIGYEPTWYSVARTATTSPDGAVSEGLSGFHSEDNLLFIIDECSGVPETIIPAFEGALSGENSYAILTSNPTRRVGYFYDVFHLPKTGNRYYKMHVSCLNTKRVSQQYIDMMKERYGEEHPIYRIKVLGEFAEASDDLLFPPEYLDSMLNTQKDVVQSPKLPIQIGVDIGRVSAKSFATIRQGLNILSFNEKGRKKGSVTDGIEVAEWIEELINDWNPSIVRLDGTGLGSVICDILKRKFGDKIYAFIGSGSAIENHLYLNIRAEGYWILRQKLPSIWSANWPDKLIQQISDIRKKDSSNKKLQIESKEEMMDRAMKSPDELDSMMYAFADNTDLEVRSVAPLSAAIISINNEFHKESTWKDTSGATGIFSLSRSGRGSRFSGLN